MSQFLDLDGLEYYTDKIKTKFNEVETDIATIENKTIGMGVGGTNYITINGIRLYVSSTEPTGDIPNGSIGIGW